MNLEMRRPLWAVLLVAAGVPAGCGSPTAPTPRLLIEPIQIESLDLVADPSLPSGLGVRVQGVIGDGCSELLPPITQTRQGAVVSITIRKQRPRDAVCIQIAKLFDQVIPLQGEYPAGQYTVRVNDRELSFSVPS